MSTIEYHALKPPRRILLGPGPSNLHPRVEKAMTEFLVGHLDPYFQTVMDDIMNLLRPVFRTKNELTFPISGTGSAGMETGFCNFIEPGDVAVIGVNGYFAERMVGNAKRYGAEVVRVDAEWGKTIEPATIEAALKAQKKVKLVAMVHAETSTGVLQPLSEISQLTKQYGALLFIDAVTSLGGHELAVDEWGIDICYGGSQKCLSCPPGLSPFTVNQTALETLKKRSSQIPSFYLDLQALSSYWKPGNKGYHHTAPINLLYAFHEGLALIAEEGIEARIQRHHRHGSALQAGLEAMGLVLHAQQGHRLSTLTTVRIPSGVNDLRVRQRLLNEYNIEIGSGLGALKGQIWRIGLMGYSSSQENVLLFLSILEKLLKEEGYSVEPGTGVAAAIQVLKK